MSASASRGSRCCKTGPTQTPQSCTSGYACCRCVCLGDCLLGSTLAGTIVTVGSRCCKTSRYACCRWVCQCLLVGVQLWHVCCSWLCKEVQCPSRCLTAVPSDGSAAGGCASACLLGSRFGMSVATGCAKRCSAQADTSQLHRQMGLLQVGVPAPHSCTIGWVCCRWVCLCLQRQYFTEVPTSPWCLSEPSTC